MLGAIDLVLRFVYVMAVPIALVPAASVFPVAGTLIGAGLATVVSLGGDRWHARFDRIPVLGRALGGMGKLGAFYREHPAKPLLYYILYPLLLPVILMMKIPRREFLLYRKLNVVALIVIVATNALDYFRHWRPDLPFVLFATASIVNFILQLIATFALVMPIVTTILTLHQRGHRKTLGALLVLATISAGLGVYGAHRTHSVPIGVTMRVSTRTNFGIARYRRCVTEHHGDKTACPDDHTPGVVIRAALDAAHAALQRDPTDLDAARAAMRDALGGLYKADEAAAFELLAADGVEVVYFRSGKRPAEWWMARDATGPVDEPKLSRGARKALGFKPIPGS